MDKTITVKINKSLNGQAVKYVLCKHIGLSSALVTHLKKYDNGIMLNGERVNVNKIVKNGDELIITICDEVSTNIVPQNIPLEILYEDEDVIAINKPRSMPTHPSQNHYYDTLANGLMYYFKDEKFIFRAITRLDRDTSGVVLIAKNPYAAFVLYDDIKNKKILKEYVALVNGVPNPQNGTINKPIKRKENTVMLRIVASDGKEAITKYDTVKKANGFSLVKLNPITGRTHQLRVHLSYIGTPIYGDDLYGAKQTNEKTRLHCRKIEFSHPVTKEKITVEAQVPNDITSLIK